MPYALASISALDHEAWAGWPACISTVHDGQSVPTRELRSGAKHKLLLPNNIAEPALLVLILTSRAPRRTLAALRVRYNGVEYRLRARRQFEDMLFTRIDFSLHTNRSEGDSTLYISRLNGNQRTTTVHILVSKVLLLPLNAAFSRSWATPWRKFLATIFRRQLPWSPSDFPYSHFDGLSYLLANKHALRGIVRGKWRTAAHYIKTHTSAAPRPILLADCTSPNSGTPHHLCAHQAGQLKFLNAKQQRLLARLSAQAASLDHIASQRDSLQERLATMGRLLLHYEARIAKHPHSQKTPSNAIHNNFFLKKGYVSRTQYNQFDDTSWTDEFQDGVYRHARTLTDRYNHQSILDVGCGSGYKLLKYFSHLSITGMEVEPTLSWLKSQHPLHQWLPSDFSSPSNVLPDLIICADVIEHLLDPNQLLLYLKSFSFKHLVISTPERDSVQLMQTGFLHEGPPQNSCHIREWSFNEFNAYLSTHFLIVDHFLVQNPSEPRAACQVAVVQLP